MKNCDFPIGVFDSGLGGLTVLKEIHRRLPEENTVYLGDTARVPYGIRSDATVLKYCFENVRFLMSKKIKLLVVACNTASSIAIKSIRESIEIPVIGVIDPGVRAAISVVENKSVAVIGTGATIKSNAYHKAIMALNPAVKVQSRACPLFVPLVEEGWVDNDIAKLVAEKYLSDLQEVDALVLGCTHYPLLRSVIGKIMGKVPLIDSALETAREVAAVLADSERLKAKAGNRAGNKPGRHEYYVTDMPQKFSELVGRFLGHAVENVSQIDLAERL